MANLLDQASIVLTPTAYDNGKVLCAKPSEAPYGDFDFSRNSAATRVNAQGLVENVQILSSNLVQNGDFSEEGAEEVSNGSFSQEGVQLVTNGSFDTDSDWTKQTGWSISGGSANCDGTQTANSLIYQSGVLASANSFKCEITISDYQSGVLRFVLGGGGSEQSYSANGTYTFYGTKGSDNNLYLSANSDFIGSIDNVSVREVGQDWLFSGGAEITAQGARINNTITGANAFISQVNSNLTIGKSLVFQYDVVQTNGKDLAIEQIGGNISLNTSTIGNNRKVYFEFDRADANLIIKRAAAATDVTITNISIKEVGMDWVFSSGAYLTDIGAKITHTPTTGSIRQLSALVVGNNYKMTYEITQKISGGLKFENAVDNTLDTTVGVHTKYFEADGTAALFTRTNGVDNNVTITNISIIEITDDTNLPRINYEGFSYQDALGSELITNGDFATDLSGWSFSNVNATNTITWETNGARFVCVDTNIGISQYNALTIGKKYKFTCNVSVTTGTIGLDGATSGTTTNLVDGYNEIYFTAISSTFKVKRVNPITNCLLDNVSVKEYSGQEVVPNSGCGSWLFEPQTTQLLPYSEDFSQSSWSKGSDISIESGYLAPDGNNTAYKVTKTGGGAPYLTRNQSLITTTTRSIYARSISGTGTATLLSHNSNTNNVFTLTEQWQRFELNNTASSSGLSTFYAADFRGSGTLTEYLIWGANATNDQDYATSYIPTSGSTVTRNQDVCNNGGSLATINSTEGTLYFEGSALTNETDVNKTIGISNVSSSNRLQFSLHQISSRISFYGISSEGFSLNYSNFSYNKTQPLKIAVKWKIGDVGIFINGLKVYTQAPTNTFLSNTLNTLSFTDFNNIGSPFFGKTKALAVWKEALSDQNLADLTYPTPTDPTFSLDFDTIAEQFTFTRGSEATYVDAQGLIQSTNEIGEEEIINGSFDTDSDWNKASGVTISDGKANAAFGSSGNILRQSLVTFDANKTYKYEFTISNYVSGNLKFASFIGAVNESGNGTYVGYGKPNGTGVNNMILFGSFEGSIDNVSVKEYTTATNTPRLDYSTGAEAFLLEPQSTNLITQSELFSDASWLRVGSITTTDNYTTSPSGQNNATRLQWTNATNYIYQSLSHVGSNFTLSIYLKSNTDVSQQVRLFMDNGAQSQDVLVTTQWQRFEFTNTTTPTQSNRNVGLIKSGGQVGDLDISIWGAQFEALSYATSYIPTNGSQTTRNQETCINATPEINSEEGVLYFEGAILGNDGTYKIVSLSDGTTLNVVRFYYSVTDNRIVGNVKSGSVIVFDFNHVLQDSTDFLKTAISYRLNDFKMYVNGTKVASDTAGNAPIGLNVLTFNNGGGNSPFYGNTKDLQVYTKALSDAELIKLTT